VIFTDISLSFTAIFLAVFLLTRRALKPSKQYACGEPLVIFLPSGGFFMGLRRLLAGVFSLLDRFHEGGLTTFISWILGALVLLGFLVVLL